MKKKGPSELVAIRIPNDIRGEIPEGNLSAFINKAIQEKLERDKYLVECTHCNGTGKIRRKK